METKIDAVLRFELHIKFRYNNFSAPCPFRYSRPLQVFYLRIGNALVWPPQPPLASVALSLALSVGEAKK